MNTILKNRPYTCGRALSPHIVFLIAGLSVGTALALRAHPSWWDNRGAVTSNTANPYAAVNQGQLKQFTSNAVAEMNADLPGGAGGELNRLIQSWKADFQAHGRNANDYVVMNIGQLKYIARLINGRLSNAGYAGTNPSWLVVNPSTDNVVANLGQLKQVFNFDLSLPGATNLTATPNGSTSDVLNWTLPSTNNVISWLIEKQNSDGTWAIVQTINTATTTTYTISGLTSGQSYNFQVIGKGANSFSLPTAVYGLPPLLAAGWNHSLLRKMDGTVWTWGSDANGQLGDNLAGSQIPQRINALTFATAVGAGDSHSLAVDGGGNVWTWGYNADGELGDGTTTQRNSPVEIGTGTITTPIVAVAGGSHHSLALGSDGSVWAWGDNSFGQLGTGDATAHLAPVKVMGLTGVTIVAIATHGWHNLALASDGSVWAWGDNSYGQIGNGTTSTSGQRTPAKILNAGSGVVTITCGTEHSVALRNDGRVLAWGANYNGQLGNGTSTQSATPQVIPNLGGVTNLVSDSDYTIGLQPGGWVIGWGNNNSAQLGQTCYQVQNLPNSINDPTGFTGLCAGGQHALALQSNGTLWGWGNVTGMGRTLFSALVPNMPACIALPSPAIAITARALASRALLSNSFTFAWGANFDGSLGDRKTDEQNTPTLVNLGNLISIPSPVGSGVAVDLSGNAYTWGLNDYGQLGRSVTLGGIDPIPAQVPGISNLRTGASGYKNALLLDTSGNVWGAGDPGVLGLSGSSPVTTFTQLSGLSNIRAVSLGQGFGWALKSDMTVWTMSGGTTTQVPGLSSIISIWAAGQHAFAIDTTGNLWAWGDNASGQLGNGTTTAVTIPVKIASASFNNQAVVKIVGDAYSTMALAADGSVWTWGDNSYYQLGDGTTTQRLGPHLTLLSGKITDIAMGYYHALALREDGTLVSWGTNLDGELGLSVSQIDGTPRQILGVGTAGVAPTITAPTAPPITVPMGTEITITPTATASTGHQIAKIIYYSEGVEIGRSSTAPFSLTWVPPTWGDFHFNFVALDDQGLLSAPLPIAYTIHVPYDSDGNNLPDWWELEYFGALGNAPSAPAPAGDGNTIVEEYQMGRNPIDYYQGLPPTLTISGGNGQTGTSGQSLPNALVVLVKDVSGNPLVNAPVLFTVTSGTGSVGSSPTLTPSGSIQVTTDSTGHARVYFQQPLVANFISTITATAGTSSVTFSESTPANTGTPAAPSNFYAATGTAAGEIDLSWTNHADNATYILIQQSTDNVNWVNTVTLNDTTKTSYPVTGLSPGQPFYFQIIVGNNN